MNRLGKVSLILSLFCFLVTVGLKLALSGWMPFLSLGLGAALFFFVFALVLNIKYLKVLLKSESLHFVGKSLLVILLSFILLVSLNYIVFKVNFFKDMTANKIHSLHPLTVSLLKALPEKVEFFYFHVDNEFVKGFEKIVRDEVQRYKNINSYIAFHSHSVFKRPDLAKEFKVADEQSTLYLRYKGRVQRVSDLKEVDIMNALLKLTKDPKKIYFLSSHKTRQIDNSSTFGLSTMKEQLERLHYQLDNLVGLQQIPEDAALLVIVGPKQPLLPQETLLLEKYLRTGGSLLLALDPGESGGYESLLKSYGIHFKNNFIFDEQNQAGQSPLLVITHSGEARHEVPRSLKNGQNPFFFISSSLEILPDPVEGRQVSSLLEYLPTAIARVDIDPQSEVVKTGRMSAAVISEGLEDSDFYRLAVVGDSDFLTNQFSQQAGTFDFIISLVSYLSKDEDLLKVRPSLPEATPLTLTQTQLNLYFLFFILPYAFIFFVAALFFKLRRFF